ncbi:hypothetical protein DFH29DRAFT_1043843 [Suillus ampliporus]|nr:hypothetical protein DFH29DRAFT_1043843 [Suillus ampliporus]
MSVFEPKAVLALLKNSTAVPPVERCINAWKDSRSHKQNPWPEFQLRWEAEVVEYVQFVWEKTRTRSKKNELNRLAFNVPLLGPQFLPPTYLHVHKRPGEGGVEPVIQYLKPLNIIHPFYFGCLAQCPQCSSADDTVWEGWTSTGARELHGLYCEELALGTQLRCNICKGSAKDKAANGTNRSLRNTIATGEVNEGDVKQSYCFATTSATFWKSWEHWKIPRLEEHVRQLHLLEHKRCMLEYLEDVSTRSEYRNRNTLGMYFGGAGHTTRKSLLQEFSDPNDLLGYGDKVISRDTITDIFVDFSTRTRENESAKYLRSLSAICGSLDNTFKTASKATVTNKDGKKMNELKGGLLSVLNEDNQIMSWRFCQSQTNAEITEVLQGLKNRHDILDVPQPKMMVADNCCQVRGAVTSAMPMTESKLDVWHFSARYIAAILNASKSPFQSAVAADIVDAILKKHADKGGAAEYQDRTEQEHRLMAAFDKWVAKDVWSVAAQKIPQVHQEQLKHVQKGCLERSVQGISSDGSRIEGSHKGWNSLQHVQPSGIVMLCALGHDFVLRRNVRVAFGRARMTPFIKFTHGSHHIHLSHYVAKLYNTLWEKHSTDCSNMRTLPELPDIESGETFGLVTSENTTTFGGLLVKEETVEMDLAQDFDVGMDDLAFQASHRVIIEEWQIDPALLQQPASRAMLPMLPSPTKRKVVSLDSDDDEGDSGSTAKKLRTLVSPSSSVQKCRLIVKLTAQHQVLETSMATFPRAGINNSITPESSAGIINSITPESSQRYPAFTSPAPGSTIQSSQHYPAFTSPALGSTIRLLPNPPSAGINNSITPESSTGINDSITPQAAGQTPSQLFFSIATGIDPRSLTIRDSDEFYLFMDMRAEFKWLSYQMTSKRWVLAAEDYNHRLVKKKGKSVVQKNLQALLRALGDIKPKLMNKIIKGDYTSKKNGESFWRRHCSVVPLVKQELGKKPRKAQTCSRCQTIMYPGAENSPLNHKRSYCADGVKQVSKDHGEDLPPWPQPRGIFSEGRTFHPHAFLSAVQCIYEHVFMQGPGDMDMLETEAFAKLLVSRTEVHDDGTVLFRLFKDFIVDPSTPRERIVTRNDKEWLMISYLQQN